jgi:predicted transcriptional regulator
MAPKQPHQDVILPMTNYHMQKIVHREKTYEFRRYHIASSVQRVRFYLNAPFSHIAYICEIDPARTRGTGDEPLPEDGLGNKEFNERHKDMFRYDFAYRVQSTYRLVEPITLAEMKARFGIKCAPRGLIYTPESIKKVVEWRGQECIWTDEAFEACSAPGYTSVKGGLKRAWEEDPPARKRQKTGELGFLLEVILY